jgi:hypothetical protein
LLGDGIPQHRKFFASDPQIHETAETTWRPRAEATARLGFELAMACQFIDPDMLEPLYIRRPEAEEVWEKKHGPIENR